MTFARIGLILLFICNSAWAQSSTAQINGNVSDSGGLSVPGAEIKVTQTATGLVRTVSSAGDGNFVFPNLPTGPYLLEVSKSGFNKFVQSGIVLQVSGNPTIDAVLTVGSVNEQVNVTADAAMVETRSTGVGQVVDSQRVLELPLNGRQPTELIFLAGMANISTNSGFLATVRNYPTVAISVAGGLGNGITYNLDGANHNDTYNNLNLPLPFPDALQEFKVETSALPAQYGLHSAATVNAITKSGTNEFHGDLFEFVRNGKFNARNSFATARDTLKRNQFGGVIGGPIIANKLFFFAGYQGTTQRSDPPATNAFVPTQAMLEGDFTTVAGPQCAGSQLNLSATYGFVGNRLPQSLLSPSALKVQKLLPTSSDPCGRVIFGRKANQAEHLLNGKVDLQKSEKSSLFFRWATAKLDVATTYDGKNALTLFSNAQANKVYSGAIGHTYLFSTNLVGSLRIGLNRAKIPKVLDQFPTWKDLGVDALSYLGPLRLTVMGNGFGIGAGSSIFNISNSGPNPNFAYDLSWIKSSHQIGFGGFYMHQLLNYRSGINATGLETFNGQLTGLPMADFLVGRASSWVQGNPNILDNRQHYAAGYIQDTWRMNSRFTMSYGLRWEPFLSIHSKYSQLAHFDPDRFARGIKSSVYPNSPAGQIHPGSPEWTAGGNKISANRYGQFFPRLGLVFDPTGSGKMTIRAAYGMFTDRSTLYSLSAFAQDAPYGNVIQLNNVDANRPWAAYPGGQSPAFPIPLTKDIQFPTAAAYITYPQNWKPTYLHQWNFSVQRQVGADLLLSANYVGNSTFHIITANQLNPAQYIPGNCVAGQFGLTAAGPCSAVGNINARRVLTLQNPAEGRFYSVLGEGNDGGTASYNGLFVSAQKRMAKGVSFLANYTWSHCIADLWNGNPGNNGVSAVTPGNRRNDRGNCQGIDQRQVFNLSAVFQAPKFASGWKRVVASNWQLSPILRLRSSQFTTVTSGTDRALNGEGGQRGDRVAGVDTLITENNSSCSPAPCYRWLNRAAFAIPALGTIGNVSQFSTKGPGVVQIDFAVTRTFAIRERQTLQIRGEAFNAPNLVNLSLPTSALNSGAFGNILSAGDPRIVQLALKYVF